MLAVNSILLFEIEVFASNDLSGGASKVTVGEEYPEPPSITSTFATEAPLPRRTENVLDPLVGSGLVVTVGAL